MAIVLNFNESDFSLDITVGARHEIVTIRTALKIDAGNLPKEYTEQPSWFAWYSALLAEQEDRLSSANRNLDQHASDLSLQLRQGKLSLADGAGQAVKLTDKGIEAYIERNDRHIAMRDEVQRIELICKKLRALVNGSIQRKDMLIQLGYLERSERKQMGMSGGM